MPSVITRTLIVASCCLIGLGASALLLAGLAGLIVLDGGLTWGGLFLVAVVAFGNAGDYAR